MYCEQLCIINQGRAEQPGIAPNKVVRAIQKNYHNNWIVDTTLSAKWKVEEDATNTTRSSQGFPLGYIDPNNGKAYINNHVNIEITYQQVAHEDNMYCILSVTVEPFSIKHDYVEPGEDDVNETRKFKKAKILNPIASCDPGRKATNPVHTGYEMISGGNRAPQEASGKVLFTYDVKWVEVKSTENTTTFRDNSFSAMNGLITFAVLCGMIVVLLVRNRRRALVYYNRLPRSDEESEG